MEWKSIILKDLINKPISGEWGKELQGKEDENIVKVIRTANFTNKGIVNYENIVTRNISPEKVKQKKLNYGDIIVEKSGGTDNYPVGRVVFFDNKDEIFLNNNFSTIFRSKDKIIYNKFLFYYLMFNYNRGGMVKYYNKTTGIQNLRVQNLINELKVPVPTIKIQKQIVEVLDEAQKLINNRKRQIKLLDDLIESIFYDMFGDPIKNDKGWESNILGEYIDVLTDYHANGSYKALRENVELLNQKSYALMIITTDLENNNYDNDVKYIDKSAYEFLNKSKVFAGDLIINKIGSAGEVYLMPDLNRKVSLGMNQFLMRTDNKLKHIYLYILFNSKNGNTLIKSKAQGAVTKTINKKSINNIELPIPPIQLQNRFAEKVELIERQKSLLQQSLNLLEDNYNNLMQKAFKGELF